MDVNTIIKTIENKPKLTKKSIENIKRLTKDDFKSLIYQLSEAYYNNKELVSDNLFDIIEQIYENLYGTNIKVGSRPSGSFVKKVKLPYPMWSLNKIKDDKSINNWKKKYNKSSFIITDKLDGNSACIEYKGNKISMYKRGDENEGSDISYLLNYIAHPKLNFNIVIRGEIIMNKAIFDTKYKNDFKNIRNMISGQTNSKIICIDKIRDLKFVAYQIYSNPSICQSEQLKLLEQYGFNVVNNCMFSYNQLNEDNFIDEIKSRKNNSEYELDGIVITANEAIDHPLDGNPKHSIAFKIQGETCICSVIGIEWNVSKNGFLKPRINIETVKLKNVDISWVSGHNAKYIFDNNIGIGSKIIITLSGDVIPKIIDIIVRVENIIPDNCEWNESRVELIILNRFESDEFKIQRISSFFKELGAKFISKITISKLYKSGINSFSKFFRLNTSDIIGIDDFKLKSSERIVLNIRNCIKNVNIYSLMNASCLFPGLGTKRLKIIMECIDINEMDKEEIKEKISSIKGLKTLSKVFMDNIDEFKLFLIHHPEITLMDKNKL